LWVGGFVIVPAMSLAFLITSGPDLGDAWSAAHGGGLLGTLHVTGVECDRSCNLRGDYSSLSGDT
jgi:hypothetical protein